MADNIDDHIQVILANAKQTLTSDHNYQQFAIENFSVLQDIDWDIARLLASTWHQSVEDIALKLTEDVPADNLRLCRQQLCQQLKSQYAERENGNILHIKTRRSVTALAIIARNVAELFYYVSGIGNSLPDCARVTRKCEPEMTNDTDQHKDDDALPPHASGEAPCQCLCIQFKYTINSLVTRWQNYDKVILDTQSQIMLLSNTVSDLKSHSNPPTADGNNSWQVSDSDSHKNVLFQSLEATSPAQLYLNQSSSITLTDSDCSGDNNTQSQPRNARMDTLSELPPIWNQDASDVSLTDLLAYSTPSSDAPRSQSTTPGHNETHSELNAKTDMVTNTCNVYNDIQSDVNKLKSAAEAFKKSHVSLQRRVKKVETKCKKISKQLVKLLARTDNAQSSHQRERTQSPGPHEAVTVPCHNRFAPLAATAAPQPAGTSTTNPRPQHRRGKSSQPNQMRDSMPDRARVSIIGNSMVRGLGGMVTCKDIAACCFTNPGATTDYFIDKLGQMTRPDDDVIIVQVGSNNIPEDSAATLIDKLDELTDDLRKMRPLSHVIVAPIPLRIDNLSYANKDIKRVNEFIRLTCRLDNHLTYLHQGFTYDEYSSDGYHLNRRGKELYASNVKTAVRQIMITSR